MAILLNRSNPITEQTAHTPFTLSIDTRWSERQLIDIDSAASRAVQRTYQACVLPPLSPIPDCLYFRLNFDFPLHRFGRINPAASSLPLKRRNSTPITDRRTKLMEFCAERRWRVSVARRQMHRSEAEMDAAPDTITLSIIITLNSPPPSIRPGRICSTNYRHTMPHQMSKDSPNIV